MNNCAAKSRSTGSRCRNVADDPELSRLCGSHGSMLRDGRELEHFLSGDQLELEREPRRAPAGGLEEGGAPPPPPAVQEETSPPVQEEPAGIPADLFSIPVHAGPEAEASSRVAAPPPPVEELELELKPAAAPGAPAPEALRVAPGHWPKQVERALRGGINPALRRADLELLEPEEIDWCAEVYGACIADALKDADPNNPWGAAAICTAAVFGPRLLDRVQAKRARARAPRAPRAGAPPEAPPELELVPRDPDAAASVGGWDRPRVGAS